MFLITLDSGNSREDYWESPCFVVRDEDRARAIVTEANEQLGRAREIQKPTWTLEEARAFAESRKHREIWVEQEPVRDIEAELAAWETARRAIVTIWPLAWNSEDDTFSYQPIEERD